jgi:excisionase family DNA binding protein
VAEKESLLTVTEAARILRVPRPRMYELLRLNVVPGRVQLGRQIRINPAVLRTFLECGGKGLNGETQSLSDGRKVTAV